MTWGPFIALLYSLHRVDTLDVPCLTSPCLVQKRNCLPSAHFIYLGLPAQKQCTTGLLWVTGGPPRDHREPPGATILSPSQHSKSPNSVMPRGPAYQSPGSALFLLFAFLIINHQHQSPCTQLALFSLSLRLLINLLHSLSLPGAVRLVRLRLHVTTRHTPQPCLAAV